MRSILAVPTVVVAIALAVNVAAIPHGAAIAKVDARSPPEQNNAGYATADYGSSGPANDPSPDSPSNSTTSTSKRSFPFDLLPTPAKATTPAQGSPSSSPSPASASSHKKDAAHKNSARDGPLTPVKDMVPEPVENVIEMAPIVGSGGFVHEHIGGAPDPLMIASSKAHEARAAKASPAKANAKANSSPSPSPSSQSQSQSFGPAFVAAGIVDTAGKVVPASAPVPKMQARAQKTDPHSKQRAAAKKTSKQQKASKKTPKKAAAKRPQSQSQQSTHSQSSQSQKAATSNHSAPKNHAARPADSHPAAASASSQPPATEDDDSAPSVNAGADAPSQAPAGASGNVDAKSHPPQPITDAKQSKVDPVLANDPFMMARGMPIF